MYYTEQNDISCLLMLVDFKKLLTLSYGVSSQKHDTFLILDLPLKTG